MIGPLSKKTLITYIIINLSASAILVLLIWYTSRFLEGTLHYIRLILGAPSFFILFFLKGPTNAMHFTSETTFRLVSFVFYSLIIALIQIIILKKKKKKKAKAQ